MAAIMGVFQILWVYYGLLMRSHLCNANTKYSSWVDQAESRLGREDQQQRVGERTHDPRQLGLGARRLGHRRA
jgi:hypothetical protein